MKSLSISQIIGLVLHVLIGLMVIGGGLFKLSGGFPPEALADLKKYNLDTRLTLIAVGESLSAILMIVPKTSPLGTLLMCGFWGGVILIHMVKNESIAMGCVLLALTMIGAELRGCVKLFSASPAKAHD